MLVQERREPVKKASIILVVLSLSSVIAAGQVAPDATQGDLQYFRYLLMTLSNPDFDPEAVKSFSNQLVYHFGLNQQEQAVISSAASSLRPLLLSARALERGGDLAGVMAAKAQLDQDIQMLANQILGGVRPETAQRLRIPARIAAAAAPSTLSSCSPVALISTLADFQQCLISGWNVAHTINYGTTCQLAAGTYSVNTTLQIQRSNICVQGSSASSTTLRRGTTSLASIMSAISGTSGVIIQNLTFDGNRFGFGGPGSSFACQPHNIPVYDLNLQNLGSGYATVQYCNFVNAPGDAVILSGQLTAGASTSIGYSNFGLNGSGSATRSTAVRLGGNTSRAFYNTIDYAGTAAINVTGTNCYVWGNTMEWGRYEDGDSGGILYLQQDSSNTIVGSNVIDGHNYVSLPSPNGCTETANITFCGVEGQGSNLAFYNNEIRNNKGGGMGFGYLPTNGIYISGNNPWYPSDPPKYVESNTYTGIKFWAIVPIQGTITLDHVRVINTAPIYDGYGVVACGVTINFTNNACMYSNYSGNVSLQQGASATYSPQPFSFSSCP
jgi:hypothetical protein